MDLDPSVSRPRRLESRAAHPTPQLPLRSGSLPRWNRLYHPAILDVSPTLWEPFFIALWRQAPTPQDAQSIRPNTIHTLLLRHGIRRFSAHRVKKTISARPLATPPGVAESAIAYIDLALARLERAHAQIHHVDLTLKHTLRSRIKRESANPDPSARRDAAILSSIPGIGPIVLATLLGEAADLVARRDRRALRCLCGVAPVTKRSGKSLVVSRRLAVHPHLQDAVHHWARVATQVDPATNAKYRALRDRGHNHARALRTVGDRLLAIACAMLRNQTLFTPQVAPPPGDADHAAPAR